MASSLVEESKSMKNKLLRIALLAVLSALAWAQPAHAELVHRYTFNESGGILVPDVVGTANGEVLGNGAYFGGDGKLYLPGGTGSAADPATIAGYVNLPNHIINVLTNLTIETWVTWDTAGAWQRIFDFGTSDQGEDISSGNGNYLFMSPAGDVNLRFAVRDPVTGGEPTQLTAPTPIEIGTEVCLTATYDFQSNLARLYSNAVLLATGPAAVPLKSINDVNNWLGRSQWNDAMFAGSYNDFRIYDNALNPVEVASSYVAGANQPSTDSAQLGALQAVILTVAKTTMTELDVQTATGAANFANMAGVSLSGVPGASIVSDNELVLAVNAAGQVTALKPGTAKLTLSYSGKTDEKTITVNARQTGVVVAGNLFADLRAADASANANIWVNRATPNPGDFLAMGTPTYVANVENSGIAGVRFNPEAPAADAYEGPLTTAELSGNSNSSIEVWAYNPAIAAEETLVAWGQRGGPDGSNMSFNYGANADYGAVGHWGASDMGWSGAPAAGQWHYLVYTFDGVNTARVYADGLVKTTEPMTLSIHPDLPVRLAAQSDASGVADFGAAFSGYIALVRVHTGELSAADVANNYLYGPTLTPPGELQGIALQLSPATLVGVRSMGQARVTANYANNPGLNVLGFSTLESSDTNVVTVNAAGGYTAVNVGTATIKATYLGREASQTVTVTPAPSLALKHRYSFNEATSATVAKDSVGVADGEIKGNGAYFNGTGLVVLPGGGGSAATPDEIAGYVDLPNHIINTLVNVSFETWVTWDGAGSWQRIFDFGTSDQGEDISSGNGAYLFLSPQGPDNLRFAVRDPQTGGEPTQLNSTTPLAAGTEVYLAATYDYTQNQARLYSNAVQISTGPAGVPLSSINDVNNWLGRSQWNDPMFAGSFNEFRIWEGGLSADQVAANFAAGPNTVPEPPTEGPMLSIALAGSNVVISWPSAATGFVLQSTPSLSSPAVWTAVDTSGAVEQGGMKQLTVPVTVANQFYRMRQ